MAKGYILIVFYSLMQILQAQPLKPYSIDYPVKDSFLWGSPLLAEEVVKEKIRELRVSEKKWMKTDNLSANYPGDRKRVFGYSIHVYCYFTKIFIYDTLGYPIKITVANDSAQSEYICVNSYNKNSQLLESKIWPSGGENEKLTSVYKRQYDEQKRLRVSELHQPIYDGNRKWEYTYDADGNLAQYLTYYPQTKDSLRPDFPYSYFYNTNNRLIRVSYAGGVYHYDLEGRDSAYSHMDDKAWQKTRSVNFSKGITGTIVTFHGYLRYRKSIRNPQGGNRANRPSHIDRKLAGVKEIKDEKVYFWDYTYLLWKRKVFKATCKVFDLKTGLPLSIIATQNFKEELPSFSHKIIRFRKVWVPPGKEIRYKFPPQPNSVEYSYKKR